MILAATTTVTTGYVGWLGLLASLSLVGIAVAISIWQHLGLERSLIWASVRAVVQLLAVGALLAVVFSPLVPLIASWAWVLFLVVFALLKLLHPAFAMIRSSMMILLGLLVLLSVPPKYAVAQVVGYIKGKSAIHIARGYLGRRQNFTGQQFWARGYYVSTVGRDEASIREYIQKQEAEDQRLDQLNIFDR